MTARDDRPVEREVAPPVVANADRTDAAEHAASVAPRPDTPARRTALEDVRLRLERRDVSGALARLDRLLAELPDDVELLCARGTRHAQQSRFDRAAADLRRAARLAEHDPRVLVATGLLACRRARWRDAIDPLREAAALEPADAAVQYYLGEAYNPVDDLVPALTAYERAVELEPSNWRALKGVGVVLDRLGRRDEATEAYRRAREARAP
ncbi:MAG: tetratricopeptide repeat protein [Gemmatimonadota bacterium]|nr:tetratricopeptide repeat protein [Gemmatimonadota bacterium]